MEEEGRGRRRRRRSVQKDERIRMRRIWRMIIIRRDGGGEKEGYCY